MHIFNKKNRQLKHFLNYDYYLQPYYLIIIIIVRKAFKLLMFNVPVCICWYYTLYTY